MTRRLVLERRARDEIELQLEFYLERGLADVAAEFIAEYDRFSEQVRAHNELAPFYDTEAVGLVELGLRVWPMRRFPHLVFYYLTEAEIRIYAVLHGSMDRGGSLESS